MITQLMNQGISIYISLFVDGGYVGSRTRNPKFNSSQARRYPSMESRYIYACRNQAADITVFHARPSDGQGDAMTRRSPYNKEDQSMLVP